MTVVTSDGRRAAVDMSRQATSPTPEPPGASGIWIAATADVQHGLFRRLVIHGSFQLTDGEAELVGAAPLQRAVVLTITSGLENHAVTMLGEALAFSDDESESGGRVYGFFNVDLLARFSPAPYQSFCVTASLGPWLSNTLTLAAS